MNEICSRNTGAAAIGFGVIAASVYVLMITVTLAQIEAVSGHKPFDMRPLGYSPSSAVVFLDALGAKGRTYYLSRQIPLDTIYPTLLALTLISLLRWFGQYMPNSQLIRFGIILSVGAALFDHGENLGIVAMIWSWPDIPIPLVYASSTATIVKSVLTSLAVLLVFLIGILWTRFHRTNLRY